MEFNQIETGIEEKIRVDTGRFENDSDILPISLEAEIPEALYLGMKDFISSNDKWDQSKLISSAIANFLFQNGIAFSQALLVIAIIVRVGLCQDEVGQQAPSTTNTLLHSHRRFQLSTTLFSLSFPIGAPPTS